MSRKLPQTSIEAWKSVHKKMLNDHWGKILAAMRLFNKPVSMEQIAEKAGLELNQVSRRMSELELENLVYKNGLGQTKKKRACSLYSLVMQGEKKTLVQQELFD